MRSEAARRTAVGAVLRRNLRAVRFGVGKLPRHRRAIHAGQAFLETQVDALALHILRERRNVALQAEAPDSALAAAMAPVQRRTVATSGGRCSPGCFTAQIS